MEIKVVKGYGPSRDNKEIQTKFLTWFKDLLNETGLGISTISSENDLGGPIAIEIPNHTQPKEVINSFQLLAEGLSKSSGKVGFDLELPCFPEPITVMG